MIDVRVIYYPNVVNNNQRRDRRASSVAEVAKTSGVLVNSPF